MQIYSLSFSLAFASIFFASVFYAFSSSNTTHSWILNATFEKSVSKARKTQQRRTTESTELLRAMPCHTVLECNRSNSKINTLCLSWVEETAAEKKNGMNCERKKLWRKWMRSQTEANATDDFPFSIFCAHSSFLIFVVFIRCAVFPPFFASCQTDATSEFQKKINCQALFIIWCCWYYSSC